jgi:hypothetical protein
MGVKAKQKNENNKIKNEGGVEWQFGHSIATTWYFYAVAWFGAAGSTDATTVCTIDTSPQYFGTVSTVESRSEEKHNNEL